MVIAMPLGGAFGNTCKCGKGANRERVVGPKLCSCHMFPPLLVAPSADVFTMVPALPFAREPCRITSHTMDQALGRGEIRSGCNVGWSSWSNGDPLIRTIVANLGNT